MGCNKPHQLLTMKLNYSLKSENVRRPFSLSLYNIQPKRPLLDIKAKGASRLGK